MASTSETGHAKNVANLQLLITVVTGFGLTYNPSKLGLKIPQLNALAAATQASLADVLSKNTIYNNKINERALAFSTVKPLATRLVNALESTDATKQKVDDAKGFNKKLQGSRAKAKETPTDPNTIAPKTISTSQQSYDQQIQHFGGIVSVLQSEPTYIPNETELKIVTLTAKHTDLTAKNNGVNTAYVSISNARINRDTLLYKEDTGLVDVAADVKKYVKSIFGASSPQYAQVKGIEFNKIRK
ncbi:MAG: hypothetical protein V4572_10080 [Bacteroidota bacterium]